MTTATPRDAARFLNAYARTYHGGAFATPTSADMTKLIEAGRWRFGGGTGLVERTLDRDSARKDFTGRRYDLHAGWTIAEHLSVMTGRTQLPDLGRYDRVYSHLEDPGVTAQLRAQRRELAAIRVSASSEIIGCWGRAGDRHRYAPHDTATLTRLDLPPLEVAAAAAEAAALDGWLDDFPYYSDGSWSALSLRGFNPADPTWGIKPAEMSRNWHQAHPGAAGLTECAWTVLAERCPATVDLINSLGWPGLERVRLLRMTSKGRKGHLARHTDVTDRAAGTRDGQITRFHLPLITRPSITMSAWNLRGEQATAHLPAGTCWYLDARKPHAVDNTSGTTRIHLVIDVITDEQVRAVIRAGTEMAA